MKKANANKNEKLQKGDRQMLSRMTGYASSTISMQLSGERTLKPKLKAAVEKLKSSREQMLEEFEKEKENIIDLQKESIIKEQY